MNGRKMERADGPEMPGSEALDVKFGLGVRVRLKLKFVDEELQNDQEKSSKAGKIIALYGNYATVRWRKSLTLEIPIPLLKEQYDIVE